jgi:hypothetical protein
MRKYRNRLAGIMLIAVAAWAAPLHADVKTQEKSLVKFTGVLGKMVGMFGGKAAREGLVSTVVVKGDRKARTTDKTEQIIDLREEKIYEIDLDDKSYTVQTFAELRKKMEDARERAKERSGKREQRDEKDEKANKKDQPEYEVDFDLKDTGEKKTIAGYDTHQVLMTITVREKGKTLDESGGVVLTADTWLAPEIPEMKEIAQFDVRYAQQLYGPLMSAQEMQQFAAALAVNPGLKDAMSRFQKEKVNLKGTPISTVVSFDGVQSKEQMADQSKRKDDGDDDKGSSSPGGMLGGFAKKFAKKKSEDDKEKDKDSAAAGPKNRATIMTMTNDVLKIEPSATAADVAVPAGFKLKS